MQYLFKQKYRMISYLYNLLQLLLLFSSLSLLFLSLLLWIVIIILFAFSITIVLKLSHYYNYKDTDIYDTDICMSIIQLLNFLNTCTLTCKCTYTSQIWRNTLLQIFEGAADITTICTEFNGPTIGLSVVENFPFFCSILQKAWSLRQQ